MCSETTILHVDDESSFTDLTKAFLERNNDGFCVETATSAEEGLATLADRPPDCVVSDYNMPGMDGLEFLRTVREEHPDLPFILFTGRGSEAVASEAIAADVTDYLQKQGGTEQYELLANRVRNAVQARREAQRADRQEQLMRLTEFAGNTGGFELDAETGDVRMTDGTRRILRLPEGANPNFDENLQHYHPDDRESIRQTVQRALRTGERTHGTWRYQHPEGDERLLDVTYTPATDGGDTATVRGAIHDVTEQRKRQQELKQARDLMSKVEVLADVGAWEYDPETESLMLTDGTRRLYGLEPGADLTLEEAFDQFHPEDRDTLVDRFDACLETGAAYEVDLRLTTPGDGHRWVTAHGERAETGSGAVIRGYIQEITKEKTRERRLTELNRVTQTLPTGETRQEVAEVGVRAASDVLGLRANAVHFAEAGADGTQLVPVTQTDSLTSLLGDAPVLPVADSIAGRVYRDGEPTAVEDARQDPDAHNTETGLRGHLYLPLGDHGVLVAGAEEPAAFDKRDLALGELLAGTLAAALDRVEREQTRRQQEQLSLFFEESPLGAVRWDDEFRFERLNEQAEAILGYTESELRGESWERVVADDDREQVGDAVEQLLDASGGARVCNKNVRKDGETITCEWYNRVVTDSDGAVQAVFSKFQDVTDRERRKSELETINSQYETLVENFPDGAVFLFDTELRYVQAGGQELAAVGLSPEDITGATPHELFPEGVADETARHYRETLNGASHTFEQEYGGERYRVRTVPVRVGDGAVAYGMAVSQNITAETARREELERQNERLEEFTGIVSHDLRNPLGVAQGHLELAQETCDSDHLTQAADAIDRSQALIEDLLTLAEQGEVVDTIEPTELATVAERSWQTVETGQATLEADVAHAIKAAGSRLQQLFENLYRNAVEHSNDEVTVTVGAMDDGFYVADTGPGVPESEREAVFEAGYSTDEGGTGFGLRTVRQVAEAHGWAVTVTESQQGGARFEITGVEFVDR